MECPQHFLIYHPDLLPLNQGVDLWCFSFQIPIVEPYSSDLTVIVGGIIINSLGCVAATAVDGLFIKMSDFYTSLLLGDASENMKYLADAGGLRVFGHGVHFCKACFYKPGYGGEITR